MIGTGTRRRRVPCTAGLLLALALAAAVCTGGDNVGTTASVKNVPCPAEIAVQSLLALRCGSVTVPQDRSEPDGAKVRLFLVRIEPGGPATGAPIVYLGGAIGTSLDYRNLADVAITLPGHELIAIELRGTGHSEPNLSCPEVDALAGRARAKPITDTATRRAFANAVASCRARIVSRGIDLATFDVSTIAADVLDVVEALHLSAWEMLSKGSTSRVVFEVMRADPPGLRGVVLSNPEFPGTDPLVENLRSTRSSLVRLAEACRADDLCGSRFPDLEGDARTAIDRLQTHPVVVRDSGQPVLMDGAALLRNLRVQLSSSPAGRVIIGELPATIEAISQGAHDARILRHLAELDDSPQTYCSGFLPVCAPTQTLNQGAYYSVLCRDEVPFSDIGSRSALARRDAAWVSDYVQNPYLDVCDAWDVPRADASVAQPILSDVPVYIDTDALSPFVRPGEVRSGIEGLSKVSLGLSSGDIDHKSFGVAGAQCLFDVRLAFFDDPRAPADLGCYAHGRLRFSTSPI